MTDLTRRLLVSAALVAGTLLAAPAFAQDATPVSALQAPDAREGEYVEVDGARIFYEARGEGPAVMLLHGYPLSGALFARMRDELQTNHTVVTVDHRGYGKSEASENPGTVERYATDAIAVMDKLGIDKAAIGGMSMGGPIVFEMFRQAPDRFSAMILIDTIAAAPSPMEKGIWEGAQTAIEDGGLEKVIPFLMPQMLTGETRQTMPEQAEYLTTVMKGATKEAALGGAKALANRPDSTETLDEIEVPTLVLVGRADPVYAYEVSQRMKDAIGDNATLAIIEGASHAAVFEKPAESAQAVAEFLAKAAGADGTAQPAVVDDTPSD